MKRLYQLCRILALAGAIGAAAFGQTLVHSYEFNGDASDSTGSLSLGTNEGSFATAGFYTFDANNTGLSFAGEAGLRTDYTIAMRFSLSSIEALRFNKIIDFKNLGSNNGAYVFSNSFIFYPVATGGAATANISVDFVLTRNSAGLVTAYVNDVLAYSFTEGMNDVAPGIASPDAVNCEAKLWFFMGDSMASAPAGMVDRILIYDGALSSGAIVGVLGPIPEPATTAIFAGLGALALVVWRRARLTPPST